MTVKRYPLVMDHRFPVICNGFLSGITMRAQLLLEHNPEEIPEESYWVYGITLSGISACGPNKEAALKSFYDRLWSVVTDLAAEPDFGSFKKEIECFFNSSNPEFQGQWAQARQAVRTGHVDLPGMLRETEAVDPYVTVEEIKMLTPSQNPEKEEISVASAPSSRAA